MYDCSNSDSGDVIYDGPKEHHISYYGILKKGRTLAISLRLVENYSKIKKNQNRKINFFCMLHNLFYKQVLHTWFSGQSNFCEFFPLFASFWCKKGKMRWKRRKKCFLGAVHCIIIWEFRLFILFFCLKMRNKRQNLQKGEKQDFD